LLEEVPRCAPGTGKIEFRYLRAWEDSETAGADLGDDHAHPLMSTTILRLIPLLFLALRWTGLPGFAG
jgi:hypothetical protein